MAINVELLSGEDAALFTQTLVTSIAKDRTDRGFPQVQRQPLRVAYFDDIPPTAADPTDAQSEPVPKPRILAGLAGHTVGSYFHTSLLWVSEELRGKRVGQALLATAELEARRRGCTASILDTFDFQAEGFYRKQGYTPFARLAGGFENRSTRIYVIKFLAPMNHNIPGNIIQELFPQIKIHELSDLDATLGKGLQEHVAKSLPDAGNFDYKPTVFRATSSTPDPAESSASGLIGHSGGSFFTLDAIYFHPPSAPLESQEEICRALMQEMEKTAKERNCTAIVVYAYDFETTLFAVSESLGYETLYEQPNWFGGRAVRRFLHKSLL